MDREHQADKVRQIFRFLRRSPSETKYWSCENNSLVNRCVNPSCCANTSKSADRNERVSVCFILSVPVKQTRMSQVSHWAAIPLADSPTGSHLALDLPGNAMQTSNACWYPRVALYWILFYSVLISSLFVSLIPFLAQQRPRPSTTTTPHLWSQACCLALLSWQRFMSASWCANTLHATPPPKQFSANGNLQYCMLKPSGCCWWPVVGRLVCVYGSWSDGTRD